MITSRSLSHGPAPSKTVPLVLFAAWALTACRTPGDAGSPPPAGPAVVARLRCEYETNPLGIDVAQPRLSWILESPRRGERQTAYHILVASGEAALAAGRGDLWDSGRVASDRSIQVVYGGRPLRSGERAWWKVRAWDRDGRPTAWSAPAWWEAGLLAPADWKAEWIVLPPPPPPPAPFALDGASWVWLSDGNAAESAPAGDRLFRRVLELPAGKAIASADFLLTADDAFGLFVNGRKVGGGIAWQRLHRLDIKAALRAGPNVLAIRATNGGAGPAGLVGRLRIAFASGDDLTLDVDGSWKAAASAPVNWKIEGFDDSAWAAARPMVPFGDGPWGRPPPAPPLPPAPFFRASFTIDKPVRRARLYATALGVYEARLNGRSVGDECLAPGWTDYRKRVQVRTSDVTDRLRSGPNAIGIVLADGWYAGYVGHYGGREYFGPHPWALAQLEVEFADGTSRTIATDGTWKAARGPIREADLLMGEAYDARREMPGWDAPGFDDAAWLPVTTGRPEAGALVAHVGPPVRHSGETLRAASVTEPRPGTFVFDLGRNIAGRARLKASGPAGAVVTLRFAERLDPDGMIYTANLRTARATDTYVLRGGGAETWEPSFTFHGFRYVEVAGYPGTPPPDAVVGLPVHSDLTPAGTFECSDPTVNRLDDCIRRTLEGNFLSVPTDCPQRDERLGWMGDGQVFCRTAFDLADAASFYTKWVTDMADAQSPEGAFADTSPRMPHPLDGAPGWGDAGVIVPWTLYRCSGDARILERNLEAMKRWVGFVAAANPDLIWRKKVGNNYGDWIAWPADVTPKEVLATAYFARSADLVARAAAALGREDEARRYGALAGRIREAFDRAFVDENWRIRGDTQTGYALALRFDLLPPEKRPAAARRLVELIEQNRGRLSTGIHGTACLLPALTDAGRVDVAYRLLRNETCPSWGYMIKHGATTIWERWDGWTEEKGFQDPGMNSFNHYALGAVGEWLYATVAGLDLDPDVPAYRRLRIRPRPGGGLAFARASRETPYGRAASGWTIDGGRLTMQATVPANASAEVWVPARDPAEVTEGGVPAARAEGVRFLRMEDGCAVFDVGAGAYVFGAPAR